MSCCHQLDENSDRPFYSTKINVDLHCPLYCYLSNYNFLKSKQNGTGILLIGRTLHASVPATNDSGPLLAIIGQSEEATRHVMWLTANGGSGAGLAAISLRVAWIYSPRGALHL